MEVVGQMLRSYRSYSSYRWLSSLVYSTAATPTDTALPVRSYVSFSCCALCAATSDALIAVSAAALPIPETPFAIFPVALRTPKSQSARWELFATR